MKGPGGQKPHIAVRVTNFELACSHPQGEGDRTGGAEDQTTMPSRSFSKAPIRRETGFTCCGVKRSSNVRRLLFNGRRAVGDDPLTG